MLTELERDVETLRQACLSLPHSAKALGALDRLVAALRREQQAKEEALERWRSRTQLAAVEPEAERRRSPLSRRRKRTPVAAA